MSSEPIVVKYHGVDITYIEDGERWRFELDGKEHYAGSLKNAKATIDSPPKTKKKFKPISAFLRETWGANFEPVMITCFADSTSFSTSWGSHYAWITKNGKRSKENLDKLIADTPANNVRIAEYKVIAAERDKLNSKLEAINKKFEMVEAPKEDAE